ncbi:GNAT family N-acetyltransferase [Streptomyces sp. NBC_01108]|uniref:GNAT family N-acetyltransferase n=1 Tax=Streptomyces sp. NBC_01108 TaxID=2903751 RepID=UPI0038735B3E|nr:GNAT family N-acetyltransferase [Streptomyces sp. NBC_01108]
MPLTALQLTTRELVLRLPSDGKIDALAQVAADGVVPDGVVVFPQPWASAPPAERTRSVVQNHWWSRGDWTRENWRLLLAVFRDGQVIGQQNLSARDFATTGEARTGFWLGRRFQGRGYGTQMRAAALASGRSHESGGGGRITEVVLRPEVTVADASMEEKARSLHVKVPAVCFIARSVKFPLTHALVIRAQEN